MIKDGKTFPKIISTLDNRFGVRGAIGFGQFDLYAGRRGPGYVHEPEAIFPDLCNAVRDEDFSPHK